MADAVDRPKDDGRMKLPSVAPGMNRIAPRAIRGGKGSKHDEKNVRLGLEKDEDEAQKIILRARKRLDFAIGEESENRKLGLDDLRFETGEGQWPQDVAAQRNFDKRPMLTLNKLPTFCNQVLNDIRQNRPAIHYSPVGDRSDRKVAEMLDGMVRAIWRNSVADIALDTCAHNGVAAPGWGYLRVCTDYESPDSFNQEILIKRVVNPFSIYLDPRSREPDGSDAKWGFYTEDWDRKDFEDEFPDADPMPWAQYGIGDTYKSWVNEKTIRVAEYFEIQDEKRTLVQLSTGHVGWKDELADEIKAMIDRGTVEIINERESSCPEIHWYKLTAVEVLDEGDWPGKWIPFPKFVGNEVWVEGKAKLSGIIRNAKQPQLMYNYMRTMEIEVLGQQPKAVWLLAEGQNEGYEQQWETAHTRARPALTYRPTALGDKPVPPPQRVQPSPALAGIVQSTQQAAQDMMAVTGIRFDATLGERHYDESGRAIRELRERGDMGSFHYIDNLARTLRHTGEILLDLIPKVYDTRRIVTILREDDKEERAVIDPTAAKAYSEMRDEQTGRPLKVFNPLIGRYAVTVTIGPSYATKRIEADENMTDFLRVLGPNMVPMVADIIAKNKDWPGADEIARRLAAAVPPNLMQPDIKDIPPQVQALIGNLQNQSKQLQQELVVTQKQLLEKQTDQAIKLEKIEKDFEAKLLAVAQKADAANTKDIGQNLQNLIKEVTELREALADPEGTNVTGT